VTSDGSQPSSPSSVGSQIAAQIQQAIQAADTARADFLKKQADLRSGLASTDQAGRASIREQLQAARDEFLAQQRQAHVDLMKKIAELKDSLKQHQDVIDQAKADAQAKGHARKGA
jgi:hypothetical protein